MPSQPEISEPCEPDYVFEKDEVHVWCAQLTEETPNLTALFRVLSSDERERASRFRFPRDRTRFVAARAILRELIGQYMNINPSQIRFSYNQYGKPFLEKGRSGRSLSFNLSHANGLALYGLSYGRAVGIDIEFVREDFADLEVAERFFSPLEVSELRTLSPDQRSTAFFNCWTRKEAYIKALGEGLSHPLNKFSVTIASQEPVSLIRTDDPLYPSQWSLTELPVARGYVAALAVEGERKVVQQWNWNSRSKQFAD